MKISWCENRVGRSFDKRQRERNGVENSEKDSHDCGDRKDDSDGDGGRSLML